MFCLPILSSKLSETDSSFASSNVWKHGNVNFDKKQKLSIEHVRMFELIAE